MKFKSDPGRVLTDSKTHRAIGKFDVNGIFETDDPYYIGKLKLLFPVIGDGSVQSTAEKPAAKTKDAAKKDVPKNRRPSSDTTVKKSEGSLRQKKVKA